MTVWYGRVEIFQERGRVPDVSFVTGEDVAVFVGGVPACAVAGVYVRGGLAD